MNLNLTTKKQGIGNMFSVIFGNTCQCCKPKTNKERLVERMWEHHKTNFEQMARQAYLKGERIVSYHGGGINGGETIVITEKQNKN